MFDILIEDRRDYKKLFDQILRKVRRNDLESFGWILSKSKRNFKTSTFGNNFRELS